MEEHINLIREFRSTLELAVKHEEEGEKEEHYFGWEWEDVRALPQKLNRLIEAGIIEVAWKSRTYRYYRIVDRDAVKEALFFLEMEEFKKETDEVPADLFDTIAGYDDIKELIMRSLEGKRPVHMLLVGPPATAKTLFLMELGRLAASRYFLGGEASKHGVVRFMMEHKPKYLLVDELDKMERRDQSSLLSVMETGLVAEMKVGRTRTKQMTVWIFACANDTSKIAKELRSRFLRFDIPEYTDEEFREAVIRTLTKREGAKKKTAQRLADIVMSYGSKDVRDAIKLYRLTDSIEDAEEVAKKIEKYRGFQ